MQAEYERVMGTNPSWFRAGGPGADQVRGRDTSRYPVDMVSFEDMVEFCRRLSGLPEERSARRRLPVTDRSRMGVCLPRGEYVELQLRPHAQSGAGQHRGRWPAARRLPSARRTRAASGRLIRAPTPSACTICTATSGKGAPTKYMHINWETRCFHFRNQLIELSTVTVRITAVPHVGINIIGYATSLAYSREVGSPHVASHWIAAQISLLASRIAKNLGSTGGNHDCLGCPAHAPSMARNRRSGTVL